MMIVITARNSAEDHSYDQSGHQGGDSYADPVRLWIACGVHCNGYRKSDSADLFRSEPTAICADPYHLVRRAVHLGSMGDVFSQCMGTTTLANLGHDPRHSRGFPGNIRSQPAFSCFWGNLAERYQGARCSRGRLVLLRAVDGRENRVHAPVGIEASGIESVVGETRDSGRNPILPTEP